MGISPFENKKFVEAIKHFKPEQIIGMNRGMEATGLPEMTAYNITNVVKNYSNNLYNFPFVDVKTCGAKGDGVTNDTAGFEKAESELPDGGIIWVPRGEYILNNWSIKTSGIRVIGESSKARPQYPAKKGSILRLGKNSTMISVYSPSGTYEPDIINSVSFENLFFDGNGYTGRLLHLERAYATNIRDCTFYMGVPAIYANCTWNVCISHTMFTLCGATTVTPAIYVDNDTLYNLNNCSDWWFIGCDFPLTAGTCIYSNDHDPLNVHAATQASMKNASFYFIAPKMETNPTFTGTVASRFLHGVLDRINLIGGHLFCDGTGAGPAAIDLDTDESKFYAFRVRADVNSIILSGTSSYNSLDGITSYTPDALSTDFHFLITGDHNKVILCHARTDGELVSFTGNNNSKFMNNDSVVTYGTAAPAAGTWIRGAICWNTEPSAGGTPGWVCTAAGTPGTWKAMAVVAA